MLNDKIEIYRLIGVAQEKAGDVKGANESMEMAITLASEDLNYQENYSLANMYQNIAETQNLMGRDEAAKQTLAESSQIIAFREKINTFSTFSKNLSDNFINFDDFITSQKDKKPRSTVKAIIERAKNLVTNLIEAKKMVKDEKAI